MITPQTKRTSFPEAGINRSEAINEFANTVTNDLATSFTAINSNESGIKGLGAVFLNELSNVNTKVRHLEQSQDFRERNSTTLVLALNLNSKEDTYFIEGTAEQNKLVLDQKYGQIHLPPTNIVPLFFNEDPESGTIFANSNLDVQITALSEPILAGFSPEISEGVVDKAFNGQNSDYWVRKVQYPLESPVSEVTVSVQITVPSNAPEKRFNVVNINPFPLGRVDIMGVWYKVNEASSWILLETFPQEIPPSETVPVPIPIEGAEHLQFIGQTKNVYAFKVDLRQRNWIEEDNKKTFLYGAQELAAKLVEFSTINTSYSGNHALNNHIAYKVKAPKNTKFGGITKIEIDPLSNLESNIQDNNHVVYFLSKVENPTSISDIIWASHSNALPQNSIPLELDELEEYFVIILMKYVNQIKISTSPFKPGTTPVIQNIVISHKLLGLAEEEETLNSIIDWLPRNTRMHFQNVIMMDVYKETVHDGSNCVVFWDDYWEDTVWRAALEDSTSGLQILPEHMAIQPTSDAPISTGTITYRTIAVTEWASEWFPKRIRIQVANATLPPAGASITYKFQYTTVGGPQTDIVMTPGVWVNIPTISGNVLNFNLRVVLQNSTFGQRPRLYQFSLLVKD